MLLLLGNLRSDLCRSCDIEPAMRLALHILGAPVRLGQDTQVCFGLPATSSRGAAEKQGKACSEKQLAFMREQLLKDGTKKYLENPKIAAAYAAAEVERAIANQKRKQAAVDAASDEADDSLDVPE